MSRPACRSRPDETFLGAPFVPEPAAGMAPFAFLGVPFGVGYEPPGAVSACAAAPGAVRVASQTVVDYLTHYDFSLGAAPCQDGVEGVLVDCGDVPGQDGDVDDDLARTTAAVAEITAAGAVPLVVGGDHAVPPMVVRGLPGGSPLDVLHIDAHLDFRHEVAGVTDGYSSPIRRLRELPDVRTIVQVGLRDIGSARQREVDEAREAGNVLLTAEEVHERGVDPVIDLFPRGERLYVTIDVDGLDPSCAPGTQWPAPGGLFVWQAMRLVRELATRCRLAGVDVCELAPSYDPLGHTALVAVRLLMMAMGASLVAHPALVSGGGDEGDPPGAHRNGHGAQGPL